MDGRMDGWMEGEQWDERGNLYTNNGGDVIRL